MASFVASHWSVPAIADAELYRLSINHVYRIFCDHGLLWLRLSHAHDNSAQRVETEQVAVARLAAVGVPVVCPLPGRDGRYAQRFPAAEGERIAVLFRHVAGDAGGPISPQRSRRIGEAMAHLHASADKLDLRSLIVRDPYDLFLAPIELARTELREQGNGLRWLENMARQLHDHCQKLLPGGAAGTGFGHGDLHFGNVIWHQGALTLIDFDWCYLGPRALDVGIHLLSHGLPSEWPEERRALRERCWREFLDGYRSVRPFSDIDCRAAHVLLTGHLLGFLRFQILWRELRGAFGLSDRALRGLARYLAAWIRELDIPIEIPAQATEVAVETDIRAAFWRMRSRRRA